MENNLQMFNNDKFGQIRTVEVEGKVHFVARDVAMALGYKDTTNAIKLHCRGVVKHHLIDSKRRNQIANVIPEGDIYRLVTHSKLPSAQEFESWIFDDVLPTIRKTGSYAVPKQQSLPACIEDLIIQQATLLKDLRLKVESQEKRIDELSHKPFTQFNTYRSCEAWLRMKEIPYQKEFYWAFSRRCAKYSHENNIPVSQVGKKGYVVNAYRQDVLERCFGNYPAALPAPKKYKNIVYVMAQFFKKWPADLRLIAIENFQEFYTCTPSKYQDAIWQALTTDISKIPEYIELKAVCKVS